MSTASEYVSDDIKQNLSEREYWSNRICALLEKKPLQDIEKEKQVRLLQLANMFGINAFETDVLATLWVSVYSSKIRNKLMLYNPLASHISPLLISQLYEYDLVHRLSSESPLRLWDMVREHELLDGSIALTIDPQIVTWLDGYNELSHSLIGKAKILPESFEFESWNTEKTVLKIKKQLEAGHRCRIYLDTDDVELAKAFSVKISNNLGLFVLSVEIDNLALEEYSSYAMRIQRQAFLDGCAPFLTKKYSTLSGVNGPTAFPVQYIVGSKPTITECDLKDIVIKIPQLSANERRQLWLARLPVAQTWKQDKFDDLIWRFDINASEIIKIAKRDPETPQEAATIICQDTQNDLENLAQKLDTSFTWEDLVVPETVDSRLKEIVFEAKERARLWANPHASRIFPHGRGLVALLSGPPGSGKSMAAQVIAAELGLDLLRVDLSAVVSKWVGETAENLQRILSSKMSQRAVLFFDEADTLYAKRVDDVKTSQDKYSNMDSGHLMVALENFDGIVLMATNLKANIDPAFIRRIRHTIDFDKPTIQARNAIWRKVICALFSERTVDILTTEIDKLSQIEATGAQIKNAVLSSVFAARRDNKQIDIKLLGNMLIRELAKDGKGLSERDLLTALDS